MRLTNTRHESFLAHPKRHPAQLRVKIGAKRDGTLVALDATVHLDTGAFASYGPAVGGLLTEVVPGAYRIPNVRVHTLVAYTNSPYSGAMRGFGSPQAHFATESLLDMLAGELGIDPLELRRKNILAPGDKVFTGVTVADTANALPVILDHVQAARERLSSIPATEGRRSGVGFALNVQTMGLGYRVPDDSTNRLEIAPDGSLLVYVGAPDLGQGLATVAEQMVAEALGLPYEAVRAVPIDTHISPNGGNVRLADDLRGWQLGDPPRRGWSIRWTMLRLRVPREQVAYAAGTLSWQSRPFERVCEPCRRGWHDAVRRGNFQLPVP